MSKYGYIGKESVVPQQAFKANAGVLSVNDHLALSQEDKLTQFGQLELIETVTLGSDTASIIFDEIQADKYNVHFITYNNCVMDSSGNRIKLRFFESGVEETASVYQYALQGANSSGTFSEAKSTGQDNIHLGANTQVSGEWADNGYIYIYNAGDSTKYTFTTQHLITNYSVGSHVRSFFGGGALPQNSSVDRIKLYASNGNIELGMSASLYGIKEYS